MPGRTPTEAYSEFISPIQRILNAVAVGRLSLGSRTRGPRVGTPENVTFNDSDPVTLSSRVAGSILLDVALQIEVKHIDLGRDRFDCQMIGYWYALSTQDYREILSFHWTPAVSGNQRPYPHLHVGSLVTAESQIVPDRFNKLHIPTGVIPVGALVRFAIEELEVEVRGRKSRQAVLAELANL